MFAGKNSHAKPFRAGEICEKAGIPEFFTRKTLQALVRARFLKAVTGPGGGYNLLKKPSEIPVLDVVHAVDGDSAYSQCVMSFKECDCDRPCALHSSWAKTKKQLLAELERLSVQDLIKSLEKKG